MQSLSAKPQGQQESAARGYEKRDVRAKWIFGIVGFLVVAGMLTHLGIAALMKALAKTPTPSDAFSGIARAAASEPKPNVPHLQISPAGDLAAFRAREEAELHTYGWVDRGAGVVRIPVDRAMQLVLQRGLPSRTGANGDQTGISDLELLQRTNAQPRKGAQQ